jgi:hypothetical protein
VPPINRCGGEDRVLGTAKVLVSGNDHTLDHVPVSEASSAAIARMSKVVIVST